MKKFKLLGMLAVAFTLVLAAVSCKKGPSVVAVYTNDGKVGGISTGVTYTATFYDDDTFSVAGESAQTGSVELAAGTYDGDPSKDGKIKLTFTKFEGLADTSILNKATEFEIKSGKVDILGTEYTRQ